MPGGALLALGAGALSLACLGGALLAFRGDSAGRQLDTRMRALTGAATPRATAATRGTRDIRRADNRSALSRIWGRLGRSPHVPKDRRLPLPVVLGASIGAGLAAAYFANTIVSATASPVAALAGAVFTMRFLFRWETQRYRQQIFVQIPEAMGLILRAIRAGLPMAEALSNVGREIASPSREEFARVASEVSIGRPVDAGLFGLADRTGLTEYFFFAVTVGLQAQTGGSLAETLDNLAEMVRKRVSLAAKMKAMTAEARMSAVILTGLPFAVGGLIMLLTPEHLDPLFNTDQGFRLLLIGGGLMVTGLLIIRGLLRSAVQD